MRGWRYREQRRVANKFLLAVSEFAFEIVKFYFFREICFKVILK